jgi:DNA anti-recombination protein RmuC
MRETFVFVTERLEQFVTGLGEMKMLATRLDDLKRTLSNVRIQGT